MQQSTALQPLPNFKQPSIQNRYDLNLIEQGWFASGPIGQAECISVLNRAIAAAGFCGQLDLGLLSGRREKGFRVESPFVSFSHFVTRLGSLRA